MSDTRRHTITIVFVVLISLTLLAAPARSDDWFGLHIGSGGLGISFGSTDWAVYGSSWREPGWTIDYHVALSGYGEWVWVNGLGQCWRPWVRPDWRPFTYGRWVWTAYGWTWVAYEPWGYFPHHFGHWAMSPVGWVWAPGTTYAPANVVWVHVGSRVGWYAAPPPGWSHSHRGYHAGYSHGHRDGFAQGYRRGVADGTWAGWQDARYATFVDWHRLGSEDLSRDGVSAAAVRGAAPLAVPRSGVAAPDRSQLARRGIAVPEMTLEQRTARVAGRNVIVARPREAASSVQRHGRGTAERVLAAAAVERVEDRSVRQQDHPRAPLVRSTAAARRGEERWSEPQVSAGESERREHPPATRGGGASAVVTEASPSAARELASTVRPPARTAPATTADRRPVTVQPPSSLQRTPAATRSSDHPSARQDARSASDATQRPSSFTSSAVARAPSRSSAARAETRSRRTRSEHGPSARPEARSGSDDDRHARGRAPSRSSSRRD